MMIIISLMCRTHEDEEGSDEWITTFADISLLLLVFFILLFFMSSLDVKKFSDSFTSVRQALGKTEAQQTGFAYRHRDRRRLC